MGWLVGHQSGHRQRQFRTLSIVAHTESTLSGHQSVDGVDNILVVATQCNDVVAVVGDGGGDGSSLESEAMDKGHLGWALLVAVDFNKFEHVVVCVGDHLVVDHPRCYYPAMGVERAFVGFDDFQLCIGSRHGDGDVLWSDFMGVEIVWQRADSNGIVDIYST